MKPLRLKMRRKKRPPESKPCRFCGKLFAKNYRESYWKYDLRTHCQSEICTTLLRRELNSRRKTAVKRDRKLSYDYTVRDEVLKFLMMEVKP